MVKSGPDYQLQVVNSYPRYFALIAIYLWSNNISAVFRYKGQVKVGRTTNYPFFIIMKLPKSRKSTDIWFGS